jgi:hypothetical protein
MGAAAGVSGYSRLDIRALPTPSLRTAERCPGRAVGEYLAAVDMAIGRWRSAEKTRIAQAEAARACG